MLLIHAVNTEGHPLEIYIRDGKIAAVGQDLSALAGEGETVLDAGGLTVLPAFVDLHCHWRTPGFEYKEDIETGSRAAAAGGYTFVNLMPNTKPVCSSAAQAMQVEQKAAEVGLCDVNQTVSITENFDGVSIDHLKTLPAGVKFITEDGHGVQDNATMAKAFAICTQKIPLILTGPAPPSWTPAHGQNSSWNSAALPCWTAAPTSCLQVPTGKTAKHSTKS